MKKLLLLALLAISMLPVYSQTSVGVIAGYNAASRHPRFNSPVGINDYSPLSSWRAGLIADHHLWKKFYLQPQLLLNNKGEKNRYKDLRPGFDYEAQGSLKLLSLELQANLVFRQQWGNGKFFAGAGPYLGRGISGRSKTKGHITATERVDFDITNPVKYRSKVETYDSNVSFQKPYDVGGNFQAGYELKNGLFFNAVYSRGLSYQGYGADGVKPKSTYWGVSVGYFFKKFS